MAVLRWCAIAALLLGSGLFFVGCGDTPVNQAGSGTTDDPDATEVPDDDNRTRNTPYLVLLTEAEPLVSFSERVAIRVQFMDGNDNPVSDAFLTFEPQQETADTVLTSRNASTDASGVAETFIEAGVQQVDFDVLVSVFQDDSVEPLTVRVRVQPKDASDYVVRVSYGGPIRLHEVEVLLFEEDVNCEDLVQDPEDAPSRFTAATQLTVRPDAEGNFPDRAFNAPRELRFRHAVARGEPRGNDATEGRGYFVTFGCTDHLEDPVPGQTTIIEVDMHNLWPSTEGTYELFTEMDLLGALPDEVEGWVRATAQVFASPSRGILKLLAIALFEATGPDADTPEGQVCTGSGETEVCRDLEYWEWFNAEYGLAGTVFECEDLRDDGSCGLGKVTDGGIANVIVELLDGAIYAGLDATGTFGEVVRQVADLINHLFDNLEHFTLHGELVIANEPDEAGSLGNNNSMRFNRLSLTWVAGGLSGDDVVYDFYIRDGAVVRASDITAAVVFHPELEETYAIAIQPYNLELQYGEIILWLIENVVFPRVFGPDVDSFDAFLDEIIDCSTLGDTDIVGGALETACNQFTTVAADTLNSFISGLTVDMSNYFNMGTPASRPCPMGFSSTTSEFEISTMGGSEESDWCEWAGEVRFDGDDPLDSEPMEGFWHAVRL